VVQATDPKRPGRSALAACAALCLLAGAARGETVTLRWRHPAPERVAGFRAHLGPAPGQYTRTIDLGRPAPDAEGVYRARVEVDDGARTHLAISAYDESGRESAPSNEWARSSTAVVLGQPGRPQVVEP
jgi:hypothetical protein